MTIRAIAASPVLMLCIWTAASAFDLVSLPDHYVGADAWNISTTCSPDHRRRTKRFIEATKRVISRAAPPSFSSRGDVAPNITATTRSWRSSYVVTFDLTHPADLEWLASCVRIAGAEVPDARRRGLYLRPSPSRFVDLEFTLDVGFYFVVGT